MAEKPLALDTVTGNLKAVPWPAGGDLWDLLGAVEVTSPVASVIFDGVIDADHDVYFLYLIDIAPSADQTQGVRVSLRSGAADITTTYYSGYNVIGTNFTVGSNTSNQSSALGWEPLSRVIGADTNETSSCSMQIMPNGTSPKKRAVSQGVVCNTSGNDIGLNGAHSTSTDSVVDGLKIAFGSGNIAAGKILLYGVKNA